MVTPSMHRLDHWVPINHKVWLFLIESFLEKLNVHLDKSFWIMDWDCQWNLFMRWSKTYFLTIFIHHLLIVPWVLYGLHYPSNHSYLPPLSSFPSNLDPLLKISSFLIGFVEFHFKDECLQLAFTNMVLSKAILL